MTYLEIFETYLEFRREYGEIIKELWRIFSMFYLFSLKGFLGDSNHSEFSGISAG